MRYELRFLDDQGKPLETDAVEAANDQIAVEAAARRYPVSLKFRYSVWQDRRLVVLQGGFKPHRMPTSNMEPHSGTRAD